MFEPAVLRVTPGTTVTWVWDDGSVPHNVTFDDVGSDTRSEGMWTRTFTDPGTFDYVCTLHGGMTGTVTVG